MIKTQDLVKIYQKLQRDVINKVKNTDPEIFLKSYMDRVENGPKIKSNFDGIGHSNDFTDKAFSLHVENGNYEVSLKDLAKNRASTINKLKKDYINILKSSQEFEEHIEKSMIEFYKGSRIRDAIGDELMKKGYFEGYQDFYEALQDYFGDEEMANEAIRNEPVFNFIPSKYRSPKIDLYEPFLKIGVSAENASKTITDDFFDFI